MRSRLGFPRCTLITGNPENPRSTVAFATLAGIGVGGLIVPASTVAIIASPDVIATTAAWTLAVRVFGGTIGYSIYYNIFMNKLNTKLPKLVAQYAVSAFLTAPQTLVADTHISPAIIASASLGSRWAFSESLKFVFITSVPFGVLAMVAAFFIGNASEYMTDKVVANLH